MDYFTYVYLSTRKVIYARDTGLIGERIITCDCLWLPLTEKKSKFAIIYFILTDFSVLTHQKNVNSFNLWDVFKQSNEDLESIHSRFDRRAFLCENE